ncbi:hypothetical protein V2J09_015625 [Rumex salicifolius]
MRAYPNKPVIERQSGEISYKPFVSFHLDFNNVKNKSFDVSVTTFSIVESMGKPIAPNVQTYIPTYKRDYRERDGLRSAIGKSKPAIFKSFTPGLQANLKGADTGYKAVVQLTRHKRLHQELRVEDYIEFTVSEYAGCAKLKQLSLSISSKLGVISVSNHALRVPEGVFQNHWMLKAIARTDQDHFDEGEAKESYSTKSMNLCHKEYDIYWAQLDRNHSKQGSHPEETTECEDLIYENLV